MRKKTTADTLTTAFVGRFYVLYLYKKQNTSVLSLINISLYLTDLFSAMRPFLLNHLLVSPKVSLLLKEFLLFLTE